MSTDLRRVQHHDDDDADGPGGSWGGDVLQSEAEHGLLLHQARVS